MKAIIAATAVAALLAVSAGCGGTMAESTQDETNVPEDVTTAEQAELRAPTQEEIEAARKAGKVRVRLETEKGGLTLELDGEAAPIAVANFLHLVKAGFYDDMPFHRVEPGFVIQAGDPMQAGRPAVGYTIADEKSPLRHTTGTIAMARSYRGGQMVPNSASTQFYICLADTPHLDQLGFTAFGKTVEGVQTIYKIQIGDKIKSVQLLK
ncbi:MAG: peptidylprolyl isomerase [Armatimonadetes bacterium]|nr:peptidylprolyl isomerase [Armatimonadota bacterium]